MSTVNMLEAKTNLSRLVEGVELGEEREVIIARNGRPVAKLVRIDEPATGTRIGVAKGAFVVPESIDAHNAEVASLFLGGAL